MYFVVSIIQGSGARRSGAKNWWRDRSRIGAMSLTEVKALRGKYPQCVLWPVLYSTCNLEKYTTHCNTENKNMRSFFFNQEGVDFQDETNFIF